MNKHRKEFLEQVGRAVRDLEDGTAAEVVVAIEPRSGHYRDVDYLVGGVTALAGLAFILYNPWTVHAPHALPLDLALLAIVGTLVSMPLDWPKRLLTTRARRWRQVREAAAASFLRHAVGQTRRRAGILLYLSLLERRLEILADTGVTTAIPTRKWTDLCQDLREVARQPDPEAALLAGIGRLGELLAHYLPVEPTDIDELANAPRVAP